MAITLRGVIRPNAPYSQHYHGDIHFTGPREFAVDEGAAAVVDKPDRPLVLTPQAYAELQKKFGNQLVCEPVGGLGGEASARRISELEAKVAELEAQLAAKVKPAK